jgi:hypothetical protein
MITTNRIVRVKFNTFAAKLSEKSSCPFTGATRIRKFKGAENTLALEEKVKKQKEERMKA